MRFASIALASLLAVDTPGHLNTLSFNPGFVEGGQSTTATLTLSGSVRGTATFSIQLSSTQFASAPATVTVPAGSNTAAFTIGTRATGSALPTFVTVTVAGASAILVIQPARSLISLLADDILQIIGGNRSFIGRVTLDAAAPNGGTSVALGLSSGTGSVVGVSVPASVTVPEGKTTASFPITFASTARAGTLVTVTATLGKVSLRQDVTVP